MRNDGEVTYYSIERLLQNIETKEKKYYDCGDMGIFYGVLPKNVINEFTACGECWQKYGYHGVLSYDVAIDTMYKLRDKILNDDTKNIEMGLMSLYGPREPWAKIKNFRVVEHRMTQKTIYHEK